MPDTGRDRGGDGGLRAMHGWALAQSPLKIALCDTEVRYLSINAAMCRAMGLESEAAGLGLRPTELFPELRLGTFEDTARQVMATGEPAQWQGFGKAPGERAERAWLVTVSPVTDADEVIRGMLAVGLDVTPYRLAKKRLALVSEAGSRIGSTLDVTTTAEELVAVAVPRLADMAIIDVQDSVLHGDEPASGPVPRTQAAVQVATRYPPGRPGMAVGGDWSDVIALSGSRVGLVVGDVAGHGIRAAATMGRLRTAVRTLADIDLEPEELLTRLDDVVTRLADEDELAPDASDVTATCLFAVYDPVTRQCTLARAGHPVPAVVTPGGSPEFLELPAGPPLGVGGVPFEEAEIELPEGSQLVLYTDGLVESRDRDLDAGLTVMRKALSELHSRPGGPPSPDAVCDGLVAALIGGEAADDAAVLVARTCALAPGRIVSWDLPAEPAIVADARARAARQVAAWGLEELAFTTELAGQRAHHQRHPARPAAASAADDPGHRAELRGLRRQRRRAAPPPGWPLRRGRPRPDARRPAGRALGHPAHAGGQDHLGPAGPPAPA